MSSFQQLYNLYEEELYSNANILASFLLSNPTYFRLKHDEIFSSYVINGLR